MNFLILLLLAVEVSPCKWPAVDALFIIDSSFNVAQFEHMDEVEFVKKTAEKMRISESGTRLALAQFDPRAVFEFSLDSITSSDQAIQRLSSVSFSPCDIYSQRGNCSPSASVNSIAKYSLPIGNRKYLPDVIVVITNGKNAIPEVNDKELLMSPLSPIHAFRITVSGAYSENANFEPSATSIRMGAVDFNALEKLVDPLCKSVNQFVGGSETSSFGPLCWIVTAILAAVLLILICVATYAVYLYRDQVSRLRLQIHKTEQTLRSQNEYFTSRLHAQMQDQIRASEKHAEEVLKQQETLKNLQNSQSQPIFVPYYPHRRSHSDDHLMREEGHKTGKHPTTHRPAEHGHTEPRLDLFPVDPHHGQSSDRGHGGQTHRPPDGHGNQHSNDHGNIEHHHHHHHHHGSPHDDTTDTGKKSPRKHNKHERDKDNRDGSSSSSRSDVSQERLNEIPIEVGNSIDRDKHHNKHSHHGNSSKETSEEGDREWQEDESSTNTGDSDDSTLAPVGRLPKNHPARNLPPIDILFLVDSSSSIGISNFENTKQHICNILDDIDIVPGRSRVALIQYAVEPSVVFGFDKYYSTANVKKGVSRMSYTGGATMMAKALNFAAGILYKEQNMKEIRKKHRLMPTPRHDRPQILCVVSDGVSDDNIDKASSLIHDKLQIKVLALISKTFHKDRLVPVTRFDGSIFVITHKESISIWIWRQQRLWAENYTTFMDRLKTMPLSNKTS